VVETTPPPPVVVDLTKDDSQPETAPRVPLPTLSLPGLGMDGETPMRPPTHPDGARRWQPEEPAATAPTSPPPAQVFPSQPLPSAEPDTTEGS